MVELVQEEAELFDQPVSRLAGKCPARGVGGIVVLPHDLDGIVVVGRVVEVDGADVGDRPYEAFALCFQKPSYSS